MTSESSSRHSRRKSKPSILVSDVKYNSTCVSLDLPLSLCCDESCRPYLESQSGLLKKSSHGSKRFRDLSDCRRCKQPWASVHNNAYKTTSTIRIYVRVRNYMNIDCVTRRFSKIKILLLIFNNYSLYIYLSRCQQKKETNPNTLFHRLIPWQPLQKSVRDDENELGSDLGSGSDSKYWEPSGSKAWPADPTRHAPVGDAESRISVEGSSCLTREFTMGTGF